MGQNTGFPRCSKPSTTSQVTTQFVDGFASEFRPMLVDMVLACAPMSYRPVYSIASKLYDST
jgi:hypothetical protein